MGINYIAVFVLSLLNMGLGGFWYSRTGFGGAWMSLVGLRMDEIEPSAAKKGMVIAFLGGLIRIYTLAWLVVLTDTVGVLPGLRLGIWIGAGVVAATMVQNYYFQQRPRRLFLIDAGYAVVSIALSTTLLAIW